MTPTALDYLAEYRDGVDLMNFQLDSYSIAGGNQLRPVIYTVGPAEATPAAATADQPHNPFIAQRPRSFISYPNNVLSYDMNRIAGNSYCYKGRGSWNIDAIYSIGVGGSNVTPPIDANEVYVQFTVCEPLLLSPFVFGDGRGKQGMYGIQTMQFQFNMAPTANRAWRCIKQDNFTKTATIERITDAYLLFHFLSPHAGDQLHSRNVCPYYTLPIFRTSNYSTIPPRNTQIGADGAFASAPKAALQSSNTQLSGIPDRLIICARKTFSSLNCGDADSYLTITGISVNWNNQAGLLSSMTQHQLYRNSIQSGLANMSWDEFCGAVVSCAGEYLTPPALPALPRPAHEPRGSYTGVGSNLKGGNNPGVRLLPTTGTILVLSFRGCNPIKRGVLCTWQFRIFQFTAISGCGNNTREDWTAGNYESVIMPMESSLFVSEKGTSATFVSLLSKSGVLDSLSQQPYSHHEIHRLIGSGFLDTLKSGMSWLKSKIPAVMPFVKLACRWASVQQHKRHQQHLGRLAMVRKFKTG